MTGELFINGKDAWTTWGINMGNGFLDTIDAILPMKEYIENKSRLEHGKRVSVVNAKVDSREMTLGFTITGESAQDYQIKKKSFQTELEKGTFDVKIPALNSEVYHLIYMGKNISYALNTKRDFSKFSARFEEPNPKNRE